MLAHFVQMLTHYTDTQPGEGPFQTTIPGLTILRSDHAKVPHHLVFKPALCIVVQGAKWAIVGDRRLEYRAGQALVVSIEMPAIGAVSQASPSEPYLGVILEFDLPVMRAVLAELDTPPEPSDRAGQSVCVTDFNGPLAESTLRMVRLLETPRAVPVLYPAVMREICFWLLTGPHGGEVVKMVLANSHPRHVIHAIHALRDRFAEPVRMEELAAAARLSPSAFHRQFKAITSMTPLQYQKQLRLIEARRLMVADATNVETAAFQVGYESASQFSREYSRMFGKPPRKDVASLRGAAA